MKNVNVSVVIPCFNANQTLLRSLNSVAAQTVHPTEIIVVDDGSHIPIEPLIEQWRIDSKIPIRLITQTNQGPSSARNAGIAASQSDYIAFLDSDDIWLPRKLEIQYSVVTGLNLTICGHDHIFNLNKTPIPHCGINITNPVVKKICKLRFIYGNPLYTSTVMVKKVNFLGFDERLNRVEDFKAWFDSFLYKRCSLITTKLAAGFKDPYGESGLSMSIEKMHQGYLQALKLLFIERKISWIFYLIAYSIELLKLPLRKYQSRK
jgi:glycosyltransferase involved in cell wall biosynthesis